MLATTKLGIWILTATLVTGISSLASAATLSQLIGADGRIFLSDENAEILIDRNANGLLDVGDSLFGVMTFDQFKRNNEQQVPLLHAAGNSELGGMFQIMITGKSETAPGLFYYTFGPDPDFEVHWGTGTMLVLYEDPGFSTAIIHSAADINISLASVTDGSLFWTLGFAHEDNGFWGLGGDDPNDAGNPSDRLGQSVFALSRTDFTFSNGGLGAALALELLTNPAGTGEFIGTSQIGGGFTGSPWQLSTETTAEFVVVPLPPAVLGGLMLMGLFAARRRRHS